VTEETLAHNRKAEKEYRGLFTGQNSFRRNICERKERLSLEGVAKVLVAPGGAHFDINSSAGEEK
jgi:hypothetical protein